MRIFISYRREDSAGHTGRLFDSLQAHFGPDALFMDLSAIDAGENFVNAISTAVGSCDVLLAVIGRDWLTSAGPRGRRLDDQRDFVRAEIAAGLERGTAVIPVLVESAAMPSSESLPDVLKPLAERQAHELSDSRWLYDVGRLIEAIEMLAGKADASGGLGGEWTAQVTYVWGATYAERFSFTIDGDEMLGTASFLGFPRGIFEGTVKGGKVSFKTRTQEVLGSEAPKDVIHRYRGKRSGDSIAFTMQSEGGTSTGVPIEFVARRPG